MAENNSSRSISSAIPGRSPYAIAMVTGNADAPEVRGVVQFFTAPGGSIVDVTMNGLPDMSLPTANPQIGPFGFHVHEGDACEPVGGATPFSQAGGHYNPTGQPHPLHAGDLPVLFPNHGFSHMRVYTDRLTRQDVVGRTVVVHQMPDDFRTQPAGDSGMRLACGRIQAL